MSRTAVGRHPTLQPGTNITPHMIPQMFSGLVATAYQHIFFPELSSIIFSATISFPFGCLVKIIQLSSLNIAAVHCLIHYFQIKDQGSLLKPVKLCQEVFSLTGLAGR